MEQLSISGFAHLGAEQSKKDTDEQIQKDTEVCQNPHLDTDNIRECQNLDLDIRNVELDPQSSDFHLSQLDFSSQDSYIAWGGSINKTLFK
ncbi:NAC domain protein [Trifolium pratense]|uniref:NAC domain protein n=1 Tax=Trifolium pratense TaxID=57577 RepID=A0A2K3NY32_TRIPR|nr:NAC domain protein [Trifolium pratense]